MYYCNKCGGKIENPNQPCSTCGLGLNSNTENNNGTNNTSFYDEIKASKKAPINIFVIILVFFVVLIGFGLMQRGFSSVLVNHAAANYSIDYDNIVWSEYDVDSEYYALVNNMDTETYLQFPDEAQELGINLNNNENIEYLYQTYTYALRSSAELSYNNIASKIENFEGTDYYYLTADYVSYIDNSVKGKIYILITDDGKALNVLLNLGSYDLLDVEEDILKVLRSIKM